MLKPMEEKILSIVGSVRPDIDLSAISPTTNFDDAGLDSLDHASVLFEVQEAFDLSIPNEMIDSLKNIENIVEFLSSKP